MSKSRGLVAAVFCSLFAMPTIASAQARDSTKAEAEDFVHDVLRALISPNWNLFAHGGFATSDRFVLQRAANTLDGQRALEGRNGFNVGAGAGVDILLRMGFRVNYSFTSSDVSFKTDDGTGSSALNVENVGTVKTHTVALEVMRYMLPSGAAFTPYGTLGVQGTWWVLDEKSSLVASNGSSFAMGPLFTFGVQAKASDHWGARLELSLSSGRNPFAGSDSFRALSGPTIDEPTSVSRTEYRIAGVYTFGKPKTVTGALPVARK